MMYKIVFLFLVQISFALEISISSGLLSPQNHVKDAWSNTVIAGGSLRGSLQKNVFWEGRIAGGILKAKKVPLEILHIDMQGGYLWRLDSKYLPGIRGGISMVFTRGISSEREWLINSNESDYGMYLGLTTPKWNYHDYFAEARGQWQVLWTLPERSHFLQLEALVGMKW